MEQLCNIVYLGPKPWTIRKQARSRAGKLIYPDLCNLLPFFPIALISDFLLVQRSLSGRTAPKWITLYQSACPSFELWRMTSVCCHWYSKKKWPPVVYISVCQNFCRADQGQKLLWDMSIRLNWLQRLAEVNQFFHHQSKTITVSLTLWNRAATLWVVFVCGTRNNSPSMWSVIGWSVKPLSLL